MNDREQTTADVPQWLIRVLQEIVRNDTTQYEHHEPRRWDGKHPDEAGGTRWLEPKELALTALRRLGAKAPDAFEEMRERAAARSSTVEPTNE